MLCAPSYSRKHEGITTDWNHSTFFFDQTFRMTVMISPFKAVIGDAYKSIEARLLAAVHVRFGLAPALPSELVDVIKTCDRAAAFLEARRLAGFSATEARRFFGPPPKFSSAIEREYLTPWPADTAEQRYLACFAKLARC